MIQGSKILSKPGNTLHKNLLEDKKTTIVLFNCQKVTLTEFYDSQISLTNTVNQS